VKGSFIPIGGLTSGFPIKARWGEGAHGVRCDLIMVTKQVSRPTDSPDSPWWPRRPSRSSELEERPGHAPDPRFLCPTASPGPESRNPLHEIPSHGPDPSFCAPQPCAGGG
jgi:hypothetical protein